MEIDKPRKRQLTMFDIFDRSTESSSHANINKRHCHDVAAEANHPELAEELNTELTEVSTAETNTTSSEELDTVLTEVFTVETNTSYTTSSTSSNQATQSAASSEASGCSNVVIEDIAISPTVSPVQPRCTNFPTTIINGKPRSFSSRWYNAYSWVEYSVGNDAMFCYPCRMFTCGQGKAEKAFTELGYRDWKHAREALKHHNDCYVHKTAMLSWNQYLLGRKTGASVDSLLDSQRERRKQENRHYLRTIIQLLLYYCLQEIAVRGHRESDESQRRGNFLELLSLIAQYDPVIKARIEDGPNNAKYTSPDIQNSLINIMASEVQEIICNNIRAAGFYSLLADETKDVGKLEQLAIVLRYVDPEKASIHEHFLTYVEATSLDAESLTSYLLKTLHDLKLDPTRIVSQGYDGASVMSGRCSGVQQRIREVAPHAIYIHCYAHNLNLALVDCVKGNSDAREFFSLIQALYVFISLSKTHTIYIEKQKNLQPDKQIRQLQRLVDTRWACSYNAINALCYTFDAVVSTLECVGSENDERAVEAKGLLHQINCFKFLILLIMFDRIFSSAHSLSQHLQSRKISLQKAVDLVSATVETVEFFRQDTEWEKLRDYSISVAKSKHIDIEISPQRRQRCLSMRLRDGIVMESTGHRELPREVDNLKTCVYYPVLELLISDMKKRFNEKNMMLLKSIHACAPDSNSFLDADVLLPMAKFYNLDLSAFHMEATLAKRCLENKTMDNVIDVLAELSPLRSAFPTIFKLIQISLTISVSTAECERCFSALKRIKTYLRSTMSNERLANMAILSIEHEIATEIPLDSIVDKFAAKDKNRRITLT